LDYYETLGCMMERMKLKGALSLEMQTLLTASLEEVSTLADATEFTPETQAARLDPR
jgi:hypothetical protein